MAASTWFHGSAWPPGNHGIIPEGSCHSAIAPAVRRSSSALTIPGRSRRYIGLLPLLPGVDDDGLAEHGVGQTIGELGEPRHWLTAGDVPEQHLVVRPHE